MNTELQMLLFATILGIAHVLIASLGSTVQRGVKWNLSARDQKAPELTGVAARLDRANKNFQETFAFFAAAVLMVHATNHSNPMSVLGSQVYFYSRIVYVPIYAAGIPVVRTLVWLVSLVGIILTFMPLFS